MKKKLINLLAFSTFIIFFVSIFSSSVFAATLSTPSNVVAPLLNPNEIGFNGQTRSNNYDSLVDAYFSNSNVVTTINGNLLWVPWFKTSTSSKITDLQSGANCNSGQSIDFTHNCMVTDEFSQIGILISMGKDQIRMEQFYNTVVAAKSTHGNIPSWKIYRDGNTIESCKAGINDNCDTASDGTARIIIALYTASKNPYFTNTVQKTKYATLAKKLSDDMLTFEVDTTCRQTSYGTICNWLSGGADAKTAGISSSDFAYTGYYPDAIIAMLEAYANTNNIKYYTAAKDFTLNYLQAANFNNQEFSVPPGKSFKWNIDSNGLVQAQCTNTCEPVMWDNYDATRALQMCQANYYANKMNVQLPLLQKYCDLLTQEHMTNAKSTPIQFYPNGNSAASSQSGYFAQGLQSLHFSGVNSNLFKSSLDSALTHYSSNTKTFDNSASIGVYTQAFSIRALGMGIGRDLNAFTFGSSIKLTTAPLPIKSPISSPVTSTSPVTTSPVTSFSTSSKSIGISSLAPLSTYGSSNTRGIVKSDVISGSCRTVVFSTSAEDIKIFACEKDGGYIEIYKQAAPTSINYKACLANGCITKDNGFARFIPTTNKVIQPIIPITSVSSLPIICGPTGKKIIDAEDSSGCRITQCTTSAGNINVKTCPKGGNKFEMYLQSSANKASICVGTNCIGSNSGFAAFSY